MELVSFLHGTGAFSHSYSLLGFTMVFFLVTLPYSCMLNLLARRVSGRLFSGMVGVVIQGGIVGKMEELGNVFVIIMR
jgi:hypothetical protein